MLKTKFDAMLMFILLLLLPGSVLSKYFMGVPYQGIMNQMNCLFRAASICIHRNSTLIIPPIIAEDDMGRPLYIMPNLYFRLNEVFRGISYVYWNDFYISNVARSLPVILHDRWKTSDMLGNQANRFIRRYLAGNAWVVYLESITKYSQIKDIIGELNKMHQNSVAFGNLQHTKIGLEAVRLLERLIFTSYLKKTIQLIKTRVPFPLKKYTAVHWRRGDFKRACLKNKDIHRCLPGTQSICILTKFSRNLVATNEQDLAELNGLREVSHLTRDYRSTSNNPVTQLFSDFYFMLDSSQFIGNSYSSITRNAVIIRKYLNKSTTFF